MFRILEACVVKEADAEEVNEFASLAERHSRVKGEERPSMKIVAAELEGPKIVGEASTNIGDGGGSTGDMSTATTGCE